MNKKELILAAVLIGTGVLSRTIFKLAPNFELVTSLSVAASYFLRNTKLAVAVPLLIMVISDLLIGNSLIFIFTWSGFLAVPLVTKFFLPDRKKSDKETGFLKLASLGMLSGITAVLIFFLWTNLGVVIVSEMYTRNLEGLTMSYINALPFLHNQLAASIIYIPVVFGFIKILYTNKWAAAEKRILTSRLFRG